MTDKKEFKRLLQMATDFHGHLCSGQVIGVRLAMFGLQQVGISDPYGADRKKLVVFVEVARCAADAIMMVSGCRVGKRSFKFFDTGKLAATFYHMQTHQAVRVAVGISLPEQIASRYPKLSAHDAERQAFYDMGDEELFTCQEVQVSIREEDTPGVPATTQTCSSCGERIFDRREVLREDRLLCRSCSGELNYYQ